MNQYEILLELLQYVQGEIFSDSKVIKLGGYDNEAYATLELRNGDELKVEITYKKSEVKEDGK